MKLKNLFAITAIASALVLTGCKEEKKADAASTMMHRTQQQMISSSLFCQTMQRKYLSLITSIQM